jgi:hypothetical protein
VGFESAWILMLIPTSSVRYLLQKSTRCDNLVIYPRIANQ